MITVYLNKQLRQGNNMNTREGIDRIDLSDLNEYQQLLTSISRKRMQGGRMIDTGFSFARLNQASNLALSFNYQQAIQHLKQIKFKG